jgi:hypothetical protein
VPGALWLPSGRVASLQLMLMLHCNLDIFKVTHMHTDYAQVRNQQLYTANALQQ